MSVDGLADGLTKASATQDSLHDATGTGFMTNADTRPHSRSLWKRIACLSQWLDLHVDLAVCFADFGVSGHLLESR